MSPLDIRQTTVAALDDDQSSTTVAVLDSEAGEVKEVTPRGRDQAEVWENLQADLGEAPEHLVVLGRQYFDLEVMDVATLVALERRERLDNRGSTVSEGPLFAVLEYDTHVVDRDRWSDEQRARIRVEDLRAKSARKKSAIKKAVAWEERDLSEVRYLRQQGL